MIGDLEPTEGVVGRHQHLCIARYHQHSTEILDPNKTVLGYFQVRACLFTQMLAACAWCLGWFLDS